MRTIKTYFKGRPFIMRLSGLGRVLLRPHSSLAATLRGYLFLPAILVEKLVREVIHEFLG